MRNDLITRNFGSWVTEVSNRNEQDIFKVKEYTEEARWIPGTL
jgi:hypothetical protein